MAAEKKTTAKVEEPKTASVQAEKQETVKSEAAAAKKTVEKKAGNVKKAVEKKVEDTKKAAEEKAAVAKKAVGEKVAETKKAVEKKTAGRKATVKKTETKKAELKSEICLQFGGNEYRQEDLLKTAKEIWKNDLKQKVGDLASVELYVKPEEHAVYYVMNKEYTGSFYI